MRVRLRSILSVLAIASLPLAAQVRIIASNGMKAVLEEVRPKMESAAALPVRADYATSASQAQKIEAGTPFDLAVMTSDMIDALIKAGKLSPNGKVVLARAGIGVGIRKGAKRPDIGSAAAFKAALLKAKSITYAGDGASRVPLEKSFESMGIASAMKAKTILEQGSTRATARVAKGEAEMVLTLVSEILPAPGVELVGPIPAEYQAYISFSAALNAKDPSPAAAAVLKFLSGPAVTPVLRSKGMEAVPK
jgi:molybdate transport system substrate-binding protein